MAEPRIPPVPQTGNEPRVQEQLDALNLGSASNIFRTFAHHPGLLRLFVPYGGKLLFGGVLPGREREMLILRTGFLCSCEYEWGQHIPIAEAEGLSREEIDRVAAGPDHPDWSEEDATILRAADELRNTSTLTDATWNALHARFGTKGMVELPLLCGSYAMLAGFLNSAGVEREEGVEGFPST